MTSQLGTRIEGHVVACLGQGAFDAFKEGEDRSGFQDEREYHVTPTGGMVPFARVRTWVLDNYVRVTVRAMPDSWDTPMGQFAYFLTVPGQLPAGDLAWLLPHGGEWVSSPEELADRAIAYLTGIYDAKQAKEEPS